MTKVTTKSRNGKVPETANVTLIVRSDSLKLASRERDRMMKCQQSIDHIELLNCCRVSSYFVSVSVFIIVLEFILYLRIVVKRLLLKSAKALSRMGRICAVLGCTSGSQTEKKVHGTRCRKIFKVPKNAEKRQRWIDALGIALTAKHTICELHFAERDVERANFFKVGNTISILPRERTTLRKDAIPQRKVFDQDKNAIPDAPTIDSESSVSVKENVSEATIPQVIDHQQVPDQREVLVPDAPMIDCKSSVSAEENIEVIDEDNNGIDPGMQCDALLTMADVKKVLEETGLPIAWSWAISPIRSDEIVLIQIDPVTLQVRLYLHVHSDLSVTMSTSDNVGKIKLDFLITTISLLEDLIVSAETAVLCSGSGVKAQSRSKHCSALIVQEENRRQTIAPRCINCKRIRKAHLNKCYRATTDL